MGQALPQAPAKTSPPSKTRQSPTPNPPVEEPIPASRPKLGLAGIRRATGGYPTELTPSLCSLLAQAISPSGTFDFPRWDFRLLWRLNSPPDTFPGRFSCQRKLFLLLPWLLTCRKRGKSTQNKIGPKSGFPVLARRQSAFRPMFSGVS